jgi:hypothetical protein
MVWLAPGRAAAEALPAWLVGRWIACKDGKEVSEAWTGGPDLLAGVGVTRGPRGARFEFMRIAPHGGGVAFFGSPGGAPPVAFPLTKQDGRRVVFENPAHDFPQRVIYAREGRDLVARVEGTIEGRLESEEWRYRPAGRGAGCLVP